MSDEIGSGSYINFTTSSALENFNPLKKVEFSISSPPVNDTYIQIVQNMSDLQNALNGEFPNPTNSEISIVLGPPEPSINQFDENSTKSVSETSIIITIIIGSSIIGLLSLCFMIVVVRRLVYGFKSLPPINDDHKVVKRHLQTCQILANAGARLASSNEKSTDKNDEKTKCKSLTLSPTKLKSDKLFKSLSNETLKSWQQLNLLTSTTNQYEIQNQIYKQMNYLHTHKIFLRAILSLEVKSDENVQKEIYQSYSDVKNIKSHVGIIILKSDFVSLCDKKKKKMMTNSFEDKEEIKGSPSYTKPFYWGVSRGYLFVKSLIIFIFFKGKNSLKNQYPNQSSHPLVCRLPRQKGQTLKYQTDAVILVCKED